MATRSLYNWWNNSHARGAASASECCKGRGAAMTQEVESQVETLVTIQGLHHSGVPCNDLERAIEFYTRVLGMKPAGGIRSGVLERHFTGSSLPEAVRDRLRSAEGEEELKEFHEMYERARPAEPRPSGRFMRVTAGQL